MESMNKCIEVGKAALSAGGAGAVSLVSPPFPRRWESGRSRVDTSRSSHPHYGSLGAVAGFMTWIWLSVVIVLIGVELDAAIEKRTSREVAGPVVHRRTI
jgi:hypothetical protein